PAGPGAERFTSPRAAVRRRGGLPQGHSGGWAGGAHQRYKLSLMLDRTNKLPKTTILPAGAAIAPDCMAGWLRQTTALALSARANCFLATARRA
ncbi:MAG: hypothetical protein ACK4SN_12440, partial [Bellilinea sp.]